MTHTDILTELNKLAPAERLRILEDALEQLRQQLARSSADDRVADRRARLSAAAEALRHDYVADTELTAFTTLDSDDFHAAR